MQPLRTWVAFGALVALVAGTGAAAEAQTAVVAQWLQSFKDFPIRQKPASFNLDEVMRKLSSQQSQN